MMRSNHFPAPATSPTSRLDVLGGDDKGVGFGLVFAITRPVKIGIASSPGEFWCADGVAAF